MVQHTAIFTAFMLLLSGCAAKPQPANSVLNIEPGLDRAGVESRLKQRGWHQVTASVDGADIVLTSHYLQDLPQVLFVYRDGRFEKLVRTPSRTTESSFEASELRILPDDPEARLQRVLTTPALTDAAIEELVANRKRAAAYAKKFSEPGALWLASILTIPLAPISLSRDFGQHSLDSKLAARFDPGKVQLGMTMPEVQAVFGKPRNLRESEGKSIAAFGEHAELDNVTLPRYSWIAVQFEQGRATRVLSHNFFDYSLLQPPMKTYDDSSN